MGISLGLSESAALFSMGREAEAAGCWTGWSRGCRQAADPTGQPGC